MRASLRLPAIVLLALLSQGALSAQSVQEAAQASRAERALERLPMLEVCERPGAPEPMLCGSLEVPENRAEAQGRQISLSIVVIPADVDDAPNDAVFIFEGGPGGAATKRAIGSIYAGPVRARDIVLVDQRGTGDSSPIQCDLGGGESPTPGRLREMLPPDDVAACAEALSRTADLSRYGSVEHADDIEAVRRALGYGKLNLRGGSYGTRAMMVYAQRYPDNVRTMFGIGVDSPSRSNLSERGVQTETMLHKLSDLCRGTDDCATIAPDLFEMTAKVLGTLDKGPRRVTIDNPLADGEQLTVSVERGWLAEQIRVNLYFAFTSQALPFTLHRALTADDWGPLVQLGVFIEGLFKSTLSYGVMLTVQCSEGMGFDVDAALERGAVTLFGNYRLEQQIQGCAAWPHEPRPPLGVTEAKVLPIPTLFLSGALDPVTPPVYAEEARALFPESHHIVLPEGQHGPFDLENSWQCVHAVWADFLERETVNGLDLACTETMHRPPFLLDAEAFRTHLYEVLAPMAH